MPVVNFDFRVPASTGTDAAVEDGTRLEIGPTTTVDNEGHITLPTPFVLPLVSGEASATLATTTAGLWAWRITLKGAGRTRSWVKAVPASGPVDFDDLSDVDPATLGNVDATPTWYLALALKRDKTYLEGVPVTVYGSSLTVDTVADEYFDLAVAELEAGDVTSYGVSGATITHAAQSLLSSGTLPGLSAPLAGSVWPGVSSRPGPVIIDTLTNDIGHYGGGTSIPAAITGAAGDRYLAAMKNLNQLTLALASSQARIENAPSATVVYAGTWAATDDVSVPASGGKTAYTTTATASVTYTLTAAQIAQKGPLAGRVWLAHANFDPTIVGNGIISVSIDGGAATNWTPTGCDASVGTNAVPAVIPVTLPTDGAAHTVTFAHAGTTGEYIFNDTLLLASENPAPVLVMAPAPVVVGMWNAAQVGVWNSNQQKVEPKTKEAVALFPNATYVPSTVTAEGLIADGVHLDDRGQRQRANDVVEFFNTQLSAWMRSHESGDAALPVVPTLT